MNKNKLYTGQGFLSDLIAPYLYYPIGVLQNMNTGHTNSQLKDIFPRSFLKNRRVAPRRPLYYTFFLYKQPVYKQPGLRFFENNNRIQWSIVMLNNGEQ